MTAPRHPLGIGAALVRRAALVAGLALAIGGVGGGARRAAAGTMSFASPASVTMVNNGPSAERIDIVILSDGYTAAEMATFAADAQAVIDQIMAYPPYAVHAPFVNIHRVNVISAESGTDDPANGIARDTALDTSFGIGGTDRCLFFGTAEGFNNAASAAAMAPDADGVILVTVNSGKYGGCAAPPYAVASAVAPATHPHELGHAFALLADEYDDRPGCHPATEPSAANVTVNAMASKWSLWLPEAGVGAFVGADHYPSCAYRPQANCLMRTLNVPLCRVCGEQITKRFYGNQE
ncbi:MAG: M64 family metallopeptidase, partial [Candidatus Binatia bacterium]